MMVVRQRKPMAETREGQKVTQGVGQSRKKVSSTNGTVIDIANFSTRDITQ